MRKVIFEDYTYIDRETFQRLKQSEELTMYQKVTLQRALDFNSPTHRYVVSLNQPAESHYMNKIKQMIENGEIHKS